MIRHIDFILLLNQSLKMERSKLVSSGIPCDREKTPPATIGLFPFTTKGVPDQHGEIQTNIARNPPPMANKTPHPALPLSPPLPPRPLYDCPKTSHTTSPTNNPPAVTTEANDQTKSTPAKTAAKISPSNKPLPVASSAATIPTPKVSEKYNAIKPPTPTSVLMQPYVPFSEKPVKPTSGRGRSSAAGRGKGKQGAGKGRGVAGKRGKAGKGRGASRQNTRASAVSRLSSDSGDSDTMADAPPTQKRRLGRSARALDTSPSSGSSCDDGSKSGRRQSHRRVSFADQKAQSMLDSSTDEDVEEAMGKPTTRRSSANAASAVYGGKEGQRSSDNDSDDPKDFKRRSTRVAINASKLDKNAMMLMAEEEGRLKEIQLQRIRGFIYNVYLDNINNFK